MYKKNAFYNLKSVKKLFSYLYIDNLDFVNDYIVYIHKGRLIEESGKQLKKVQKRILKLLNYNISGMMPKYVYSKKGSSWIDNGLSHKDSIHFYKLDISKFYPSIGRERVFYFFYYKMKTSKDVANILADILSVDIKSLELNNDVLNLYNELKLSTNGKIKRNHLPTGAPTSAILSILVNLDMFYELNQVANLNGLIFSVYIDDLTFSSKYKIGNNIVSKINNIINKNKYNINKHKSKTLNNNRENILITGVVIKKQSNKITIKNKLSKNIYLYIKNKEQNKAIPINIEGMINTVKQISKKDYNRFNKYIS